MVKVTDATTALRSATTTTGDGASPGGRTTSMGAQCGRGHPSGDSTTAAGPAAGETHNSPGAGQRAGEPPDPGADPYAAASDGPAQVDARALGALPDASREVADLWRAATRLAVVPVAPAGLAAGERPAADVEILAATVAVVEYELARRMHTAHTAGALPLQAPGAMLAARGWSRHLALRLARCGALAATHASVAAAWSAGLISSEHLDPIAKATDKFTTEELAALVAELDPHWGSWPPATIARFVHAADHMLHPRPDPTRDEADAHDSRFLSFAVTKDSVLLSGSLPILEGELVIAAIDALAERLRSAADHVPAAARRADALVELVNTAHASDVLPTRGGLPVALTVTLAHTNLGDPVWSTSRGHQLTTAEARWASCDADLTPILTGTDRRGPHIPAPRGHAPGGHAPAGVEPNHSSPGPERCIDLRNGATSARGAPLPGADAPGAGPPGPAARIAALAALMFDPPMPLAVGRTQRTATSAQRRALAQRDHGCVIPGCAIPAEACQAHHLTEWADSGTTDLSNLVLLCWTHHRQVDLKMWTIHPGRPPGPAPDPGAPPGTAWPANNGAPFTIRRTPRHRWRT